MDKIGTTALLALFLALAVFFGWRGAQPPNIGRGPRLIPYRLLMLLMAVGVVIALTHEASLFGLTRRQ